ncbi:MAG: epoxyqueuosine reductase QueH [Clostridiaceae bacterium]|nr:epoxyqueuosine reductase QueH [Clostridiaceae bacterium]
MTQSTAPKKLLLHTCCGPCAMWPLERLLEEGIDVTLFFFNPNIHPAIEWQRRLENAVKVADHYGVPMIVKGCSMPQAWLRRAEDGDERCRYCYQTRLSCVADQALADGFDAISTTLFVSPYQNRDLILEEGGKAIAERDLAFSPYDWRDGYRRGQTMAKEIGLYRQKYCGCIISLKESSYWERISQEHEQLAIWGSLSSGGLAQQAVIYDAGKWEKQSDRFLLEDESVK